MSEIETGMPSLEARNKQIRLNKLLRRQKHIATIMATASIGIGFISAATTKEDKNNFIGTLGTISLVAGTAAQVKLRRHAISKGAKKIEPRLFQVDDVSKVKIISTKSNASLPQRISGMKARKWDLLRTASSNIGNYSGAVILTSEITTGSINQGPIGLAMGGALMYYSTKAFQNGQSYMDHINKSFNQRVADLPDTAIEANQSEI